MSKRTSVPMTLTVIAAMSLVCLLGSLVYGWSQERIHNMALIEDACAEGEKLVSVIKEKHNSVEASANQIFASLSEFIRTGRDLESAIQSAQEEPFEGPATKVQISVGALILLEALMQGLQ